MKRILAATVLSLALVNGVSAQGVRVKLPAWQEPVLLDTMRQEHALRGAPEKVYSAVLDAYRELEIPTGNTDGKVGIIGSERFEKSRYLAGAPMSMSFSCGESATGPNADNHRLTIAIVTWVTAGANGGTTLAVAAAASAQDPGGASRATRPCASTGRIELKIKERVEKLVAR